MYFEGMVSTVGANKRALTSSANSIESASLSRRSNTAFYTYSELNTINLLHFTKAMTCYMVLQSKRVLLC